MREIKKYFSKQKRLRVNTAKKSIDEQSLRVALSRLKKSGLIEQKRRGAWLITKRGKEYLTRRMNKIMRHTAYEQPKKENTKTIIIFDIPEKLRVFRDELRWELFLLGFALVQKSVWMGEGALPKAFVEYLRDRKLLPHVKIFSIKETGTLYS
jgi:DNA-binding transcriptional regulator PaaX